MPAIYRGLVAEADDAKDGLLFEAVPHRGEIYSHVGESSIVENRMFVNGDFNEWVISNKKNLM